MFDWRKYKWWQWGIVAFVVMGIVGSILPKSETTQVAPQQQKKEEKKVVIEDTICDKERALKYIKRWDDKKVGVGFSESPLGIVTKRATWLTIGEEGQIAMVAIVDCAAAGNGKHLNGLRVFDLQKNEIAKYDAMQLMDFRKMAKPVLTKDPDAN